ncbi:MAG: hypothetical protein KBD00_06230 [Candidatus Peribacteraceae bacterium]|nr:hypothetical protein [Candidatus Peribacteraceae bacterium]
MIVHGLLLTVCLIIIARLIELQVLNRDYYHAKAQAQQFGGVEIPAKRGEILSRNSKTSETSIFATNASLDLLYIDPTVIKSRHSEVADALADVLVTKEFDAACRSGNYDCPIELIDFYREAFDPLKKNADALQHALLSGSGGVSGLTMSGASPVLTQLPLTKPDIADITEIRRRFARGIEDRITENKVTFVPLKYGANKVEEVQIEQKNFPGIFVNKDENIIYCNPELVSQRDIPVIAHDLSPILQLDQGDIASRLRQRSLRYVPIMGKLSPDLSRAIKGLKAKSATDIEKQIASARARKETTKGIEDPYRSLALVQEHWRFYPDTRIASHIIGFIIAKERGRNALQEPQYGIERAYDAQLRGQQGRIESVSDRLGGQVISTDQKFIDPRDGASIVLTIDRFVQSKVEDLLEDMVKKVDAESGQVIIMDPFTGKVIAMANAPRFDNNAYASVYEKEPMLLPPEKESSIVIEIFNPETNTRMLKAYLPDLSAQSRAAMSPELRKKLAELEKMYDLPSITRYYLLVGEHNRREIFPTAYKGIWLKYKNNIGVGSYVNRTVQEIYEPGSVMKPVTIAIAIDQGEIIPEDTYQDDGPVIVDKFPIRNALHKYYGLVSMVQCLNYSLNTCLQSISQKLGRKLFYAELKKFGFGNVTGIELDNELPGVLRDWRTWSNALISTTSFGQGISATPMQMITAYTALANGGKLMKPTIIDEIRYSDGTVEKKAPIVVGQVIKPETSATITAMLVNSAANGFASAGKPKGYRIAGKTGTSQIAGPGGKYETGTGSTTATYAGYAPVDHPKFIILVKLDRPKKDDFGSKSAAPLFKDIATFLFNYYGIPPDETDKKK